MNTGIITTSPNIEGNIGVCQVNTSRVSTGVLSAETYAVNSCTGEVVQRSEIFYGPMWFFATVIFFGVVFVLSREYN